MGIIIDRCADAVIFSTLDELKIEYYKSANIEKIYKPVNTHPDMQIHFISNDYAIVAPCVYEYYRTILPAEVRLQKGESDPDGKYPGDVLYNIAKVGNHIIGNFKYTDKVLLQIYRERGFKFINVKQGYAKCNLCVVDDNSVITEDEGIFNTLKAFGMDVLLIFSKEVSLNGFPNGFIGGASGFIKNNTLAFCGDLSTHNEFLKIKSFIEERKVNIKCLSSTKMCDLGSILYFNVN